MRGLILAALAADLAVLVYLNALPHPFVYDDLVGVVGNPALVDGAGPLEVIRQNVFRPVVSLSFALDHALWGFRPVGYHLTSVLLHALNVALLFVLARRLAVDWRGGDAETGREPDVVAFVAAALFAVHPMMSEAVGYVSGRADALATSFVLLALLALRAGLERPAWRAPGLALALLGAATKEVAVVLPVLALAWDRCLLDGDPAARRRRLLRWHLPFLGAAVALGLARATSFLLIERSTTSAAAWPYLQTQLGVVWRYVRLLLIPVGQSACAAGVPVSQTVNRVTTRMMGDETEYSLRNVRGGMGHLLAFRTITSETGRQSVRLTDSYLLPVFIRESCYWSRIADFAPRAGRDLTDGTGRRT